ncbi:MAG: fibronectin type III domain-containing protein [Chromatiaceae bacterium]|nr:fibronectin type III domain-containing protein [Chromatiaceae bacterium]
MSNRIDRWARRLAHSLLWIGLAMAMAARAAEPLCSTDIDGDGTAAATTDGQLLLRHLFGFAGDELISGVVGSGCTRCDAVAIATHLETVACRVFFDVDGDGTRGALTDGLLVWRQLAGLTGRALTDGALGQGAVRTDAESVSGWLSLGVLPAGEAPWKVQLVAGNALQGDRIELEWLTTIDDDTQADALRYVLHAATTPAFQPDASTANTQVVDAAFGTLTGLSPETGYYVKVEAIDAKGNSSWSNELAVLTAAAAPTTTGAPYQVLDDTNALDQVVTADSVSYRLPSSASPPAVGDLILSTFGEGYLRRVTSVSLSGDQVTLGTAAADLSQTFNAVQLASDVKLIDLPSQQNFAGVAAMRTLTATQQGDVRSIHWPERGLTLSQTTLPTALGVRATAAAAAACNGSGSQLVTRTDSPLQVTFPTIACVEPGSVMIIEIHAEIQSGSESEYELTQLQFEDITHPQINKNRTAYGATWAGPTSYDYSEGKGTLS